MDHEAPSCRRIAVPIDPSTERPRVIPELSGTSRVALPAIPTSWTRGRRRRSRPRCPPGWLGDPDISPGIPDGPASPGTRNHPDLPLRYRVAIDLEPPGCPGSTRPSRGGCSIRIARRCRSRRATSSRRWHCSTNTVRRSLVTGPPRVGPGVDTAFDAGPDAGRPPSGDQAVECVQVRARGGPHPSAQSRIRSTAAC